VIRIDAHHHVWQFGTRPHAWLDGGEMATIRRDFTLADLALVTAAAGIDRTITGPGAPQPGRDGRVPGPGVARRARSPG